MFSSKYIWNCSPRSRVSRSWNSAHYLSHAWPGSRQSRVILRISLRASALLSCSDSMVRIRLDRPLGAAASRSSCFYCGEQDQFFLTHVKVEIVLHEKEEPRERCQCCAVLGPVGFIDFVQTLL